MTNEQKVYSTALNNNIPGPLALLIVAQSKHESNDYTSAVFLDCNNSFGYKALNASQSCPLHPDYKKYSNIEESTLEIVNWIGRRLNEGNFPPLDEITTAEQYAQLLKDNGYYGDSVYNYTNGLLNWFKSNISIVTGSGILIAALFFF